MDIRDESLKAVLERISDEHGITFFLPPSLAEEKVMMRFSNLTLEEGLNKILGPYNRIFIYSESRGPSQLSSSRLKEVRVFPWQYEGRVKEPLMKVAEGVSETRGNVPSEGTGEEKRTSRSEVRRNESYIDTLTTVLKGQDTEAKLDAVKVLKDAETVDAVKALSFALRDNDPGVRNEAVRVLKGIGSGIVDEGGVDIPPEGDDSEWEKTDNPPPKPEEGPPPTLQVVSSGGESTSIGLNNEVPVRGVQFNLSGVTPSEVRTTPRTEGFLVTHNNNKVILVSISGKTIPPGSGPVVEVVGSSRGSARLSGVVIGK